MDGKQAIKNGLFQLQEHIQLRQLRKGGIQPQYVNNFGRGAYTRGEFYLTAGQELTIVVGQTGQDNTNADGGTGGGGATFVVTDTNSTSIIAGGGSGMGGDSHGQNASTGTSGLNGEGATGWNERKWAARSSGAEGVFYKWIRDLVWCGFSTRFNSVVMAGDRWRFWWRWRRRHGSIEKGGAAAGTLEVLAFKW